MNAELIALIDRVEEAISPYNHVLIGYSGGVDSTVLLHLLYQLREYRRPELDLQAVHVHHGLSCHADDWVRHCQAQCSAWRIPLKVSYVTLNSSEKNIEAAARSARYNVFNENLTASQILVTAHHLDDQCETFLLALKRGSGPKGLSAMSQQRAFYSHQLIRPLLFSSKETISEYAITNQLSWIEDDSNQSDHFERNFLRLHILPSLQARWPQFNSMVARSAALCAEQEALLTHYLAQDAKQAIDEKGCFLIESLIGAPEVKCFALLRYWLAQQQQLMPTREQLKILLHEVVFARADANPRLQLLDREVKRFKNKLYLLPHFQTIPPLPIAWDMQTSLLLPDNLGKLVIDQGDMLIRAPRQYEKVSIRFFSHDRVLLKGKKQSRPIKKVWQELGIAPWIRRITPLLYYNEKLIAAMGYFVTEESQVLEQDKRIMIQHLVEQ